MLLAVVDALTVVAISIYLQDLLSLLLPTRGIERLTLAQEVQPKCGGTNLHQSSGMRAGRDPADIHRPCQHDISLAFTVCHILPTLTNTFVDSFFATTILGKNLSPAITIEKTLQYLTIHCFSCWHVGKWENWTPRVLPIR